MSVTQTHIIRRQNVKVTATVQDAFALKRKIELLMEDISPKMNSLFDELISENEWLQIDALDIHIDDLSEQDLEEKLAQRILQSIHDKIDARKYNTVSLGDGGQKGFELISVHQKTMAAFLYFLENGILPWWFETGSHSLFEEQLTKALELFISDSKIKKATHVLANLRSTLHNFSAQKRLSEQFNQQIYFQVLHLLSIEFGPNAFSEIENVYEQLSELLISKAGNYKKISVQIFRQSKVGLIAKVIASQSTGEVLKRWTEEVYNELQYFALKKVLEAVWENAVLKKYVSGEFTDFQSTDERSERERERERERSERERERDRKDAPLKIKNDSLVKELGRVDGAIVSNAGLIVVAPFLPELFKQCGILKNNKIIDFNKALALLHYTVFGNCRYREYDVLLNKVLCGMDENQPIELIEDLTEQDKKEIETMLTTAVSYWTALKGTSPDGLREGFMVRKGKLLHKYEDWFLQVEQSAIDALLQQLPWTIGFIKLPWMKTMLRTQWI